VMPPPSGVTRKFSSANNVQSDKVAIFFPVFDKTKHHKSSFSKFTRDTVSSRRHNLNEQYVDVLQGRRCRVTGRTVTIATVVMTMTSSPSTPVLPAAEPSAAGRRKRGGVTAVEAVLRRRSFQHTPAPDTVSPVPERSTSPPAGASAADRRQEPTTRCIYFSPLAYPEGAWGSNPQLNLQNVFEFVCLQNVRSKLCSNLIKS